MIIEVSQILEDFINQFKNRGIKVVVYRKAWKIKGIMMRPDMIEQVAAKYTVMVQQKNGDIIISQINRE